MKKIAVMCVVLTGCGGGFNDMDAKRDAIGGNSGNNSGTPNNPSIPDVITNWQYSSLESDGRVVSLKANNASTNYFFDPKVSNIKNSPWIELEKRLSLDNAEIETVAIFVNANMSCTPSCNVNMTFNGESGAYQMRNSIDGVLVPVDGNTERLLFKKFSISNKATVSIPVIGLPKPFDASYDLSNFDADKMDFVNY